MMGEIHLEHTIDTGHRIVGHKGKCQRLHGHTYRIAVWCKGEIKEPGFVVDFGDLKDLLNEWDHRMLLWDQDDVFSGMPDLDYQLRIGVLYVPFNPTVEHMVRHLAKAIGEKFELDSVSVTMWETPKCSADYFWWNGHG